MDLMQTTTKAFDLLHDANARETEREWLQKLENREWLDFAEKRQVVPGISVIVPAHRAVETIYATVASLAAQTMPASQFEVIVVCNGEDDGTTELLGKASREFADLRLKVFYSDLANAGSARNLGIATARHEFVTFVDADDQVQPRFLENAYKFSSDDKIVVSPIINCFPDGSRDEENALNRRIVDAASTTVSLAQVPWILGFNACKLVSIRHLSNFKYDVTLRSGEDLVFFAHLLTIPDLKVVFPPSLVEASYVRTMRQDSISRQKESFDFNVQQRVDCVTALQRIAVEGKELSARRVLENAQVGFIQRYLDKHPEEVDRLEEYLGKVGFINFPWNLINKGRARDLAISYCFSPFSDTSAVVAEKAVAERRKIVDVISNDMSKVRHVDESLSFLSSRWIDRRFVIDAPPSFAGWPAISEFAEKSLLAAEERAQEVGGYETLYSRALWVGSHVAAALFKNRHFEVRWTAEFSDPLRFGVQGEQRPGAIVENKVTETLRRVISTRGFGALKIQTLFDLVEAATLILADEVIFTNKNQLEYVLSSYPENLQNLIHEKTVVRPHPTPSAAAYSVVPTNYSFDSSRVNIGYFGSFYINRGLGDLFTALFNLRREFRDAVAIHIFCNSIDTAQEEVAKWGLSDVVKIKPYLPYMEFLNATSKFDVLLVNDIARGSGMSTNPFLPSKLSDYRGSSAKIWGLIDKGSPLSQETLDFASPVGNSISILKTLEAIIKEQAPRAISH